MQKRRWKMIKWLLTTILLIITVAVVTVIMESPSLRAKAQKTLKAKTAMISARINEVKALIADKEGIKNPKGSGGAKNESSAKELHGPTGQNATGDQIQESDRKKLEKILEKANKESGKAKP